MYKKELHNSCLKYAQTVSDQISSLLQANQNAIQDETADLLEMIQAGGNLFVFGCGHSSLFAAELYHRAGGASFVIPLVADFLLPFSGPSVVRQFERMPESATYLLKRHEVGKNDRVWIASQSGINPVVVEFALETKKTGAKVVGFTSKKHSQSVASRHSSGKKLMDVADRVLDLGGEVGDAAVELAGGSGKVGPLSTLSMVYLGQLIVVNTLALCNDQGLKYFYTSVNTPEGEKLNKSLEQAASKRDPLLR